MKWTCGRCWTVFAITSRPDAVGTRRCDVPGCSVQIRFANTSGESRACARALYNSLPPIAKQVLRAKEQLGAS